jgi:biotin carboxyl carrier protein
MEVMMEMIPLKSQWCGQIVSVSVTEGEAVGKDHALLVIEIPSDLKDIEGLVSARTVATHYRTASSGSSPCVKIGDRVRKGDTIYFVGTWTSDGTGGLAEYREPVPAPRSGKITKIFFRDGDSRDYDQPCMVIEPEPNYRDRIRELLSTHMGAVFPYCYGTLRRSNETGTRPMVELGSKVQRGDELCYVQIYNPGEGGSAYVFLPVFAPTHGEIVQILFKDGDSVDDLAYPIMVIE